MRVQLDTSVPVIFGVLCVLNEEQALQRAGLSPGMHNHGTEWAQSALQMASVRFGKSTVSAQDILANKSPVPLYVAWRSGGR